MGRTTLDRHEQQRMAPWQLMASAELWQQQGSTTRDGSQTTGIVVSQQQEAITAFPTVLNCDAVVEPNIWSGIQYPCYVEVAPQILPSIVVFQYLPSAGQNYLNIVK